MAADSIASVNTQRPMGPRVSLSLPFLVALSALILLSWSAFNWLTWPAAVVLQLPPLLLIMGLSVLLERLWEWSGLARPWRIELGRRGLILYFFAMAFLIAADPGYAQAYGIRIAERFIDEFDIAVHVESREFVLLESPVLTGKHRPFRGTTTVYGLLDPADEAESKIRNRLRDERGWLLSNGIFLGSCDRDRVDRYITIFITGDDALHVAIHYGVPSYCLLDLLE